MISGEGNIAIPLIKEELEFVELSSDFPKYDGTHLLTHSVTHPLSHPLFISFTLKINHSPSRLPSHSLTHLLPVGFFGSTNHGPRKRLLAEFQRHLQGQTLRVKFGSGPTWMQEM